MSGSQKNELLAKVSAAEQRITGKRFCVSCQALRAADTGEMVGDKVRRWKCAVCLNREATRKYEARKKRIED